MRTTVVVNRKKIILTDKEYVASGGEAAVYKRGRTAYKIYHDPLKMIATGKIEELSCLSSSNVLRPKSIIHRNNKAIGYTMDFVDHTHPICKLFTKNFRNDHSIDPKRMIDIVKHIQETITQIHNDGCLVVDLNELNLLASNDFGMVHFIDVDSYQTKSYKATAIMESIRDWSAGTNFTELSDWFSFGIIAFQLYIGIHPYKGKHPNYKPKEWIKRMRDGVSVFDNKVKIPKLCNDFGVIPKPHLDWFKSLFVKNERSIAPFPDAIIVIVQPQIRQASGDFSIDLDFETGDNIQRIYYFDGVEYIIGKNFIYKNRNIIYDRVDYDNISMVSSGDGSDPLLCTLKDDRLFFMTLDGTTIDQLYSNGYMQKNGCIYSMFDGKLVEIIYRTINNKNIRSSRHASNISDLSSKVFNGVIFQDLLGKSYITLPFERGKCVLKPIKEMDSYRILSAKSEQNICIAIAEKNGKYYRFIIVFDKLFSTYKIRLDEDVSYSDVNFTVKPNGVCILALDDEVEIFKDEHIKRLSNSPFDSGTPLFNKQGDIFFIVSNKIYSVKSG